MDLSVRKVTARNKESKRVKEIFKSSFPKEERMPFWMMFLMAKINNTEFLSFYDKDTLCGFVYLSAIKNITFIIYLAVDSDIRSKGYGSSILTEIRSMYQDNKMILYIDRCDNMAKDSGQRVRRKNFYINNGYEETGYLVNSTKEMQEILIKNGKFDKEEFLQFFKAYSNGTMKPKISEI